MARLPSFEQLGEARAPRPELSVVQDRSGTQEVDAEGRALAQVGNQLQGVSNELWAFKEKADTIRVEDAWNQYKNAALDLTAGPQGLLKTQGADAVNGDLVGKSTLVMTDARRKIGERLTDEQRLRFDQRADITDLDTKKAVLGHLATEAIQYGKIVFQGSEAAARAQVAASPTDPGVFTGAKDTLLAQADQYLNQNGVQDKGTRDGLKDKLVDSLWATRLNAIMDTQPVLADAMFRANSKEIKDPELRLVLGNKISERAMGVSATNEAEKLIQDFRSEPPKQGRATPEGGPAAGTFTDVVGSLLKREGGYVARDGKSGAPANFGINQKYNPDVDVKNLTRERAIAIYKERYWDKINGDDLAPATALVALDAAALQGPEIAKKLIASTGGDPTAMIETRRAQLRAIAAKDPEQAKNLPGWLARMDSLQAEVQQLPQGSLRNASMTTTQVDAQLAPNTNGMPNSRDIAAQLPMILMRVNKRADELYGPDQGNPMRAAWIRRTEAEVESKVRHEVQQMNAIQREAQGNVLDAIIGVRMGAPAAGQPGVGMVLTSLSQVQANPGLMRDWQRMDSQAKLAALNLLDRNRAQKGDIEGDVVLYRQLFDRIHLEPGDPRKIDFYQQLVQPEVANRLSMQQIGVLRQELDRAETPGGRSLNQMRKAADANVALYFRTTPMFTAQPERQIGATMKWNEDAGKKIDEWVKAGKDVRALFTVDGPDSIISPKYLQTYVATTPATGVAGAAAVKDGKEVPLVERTAVQPPTIKTREELDAWFKSLPPTVDRFTGPDGVVRMVPPRPKATPDKKAPGLPRAASVPRSD